MTWLQFLVRCVVSLVAFGGLIVALAALQAWLERRR